jgi:hypothetical protein
MGLVATMTALVLGLVTASAKSSFEAVAATVRSAAADTISLDRTLARYGPESQIARDALHDVVRARLDMTWPQESARTAELMSMDALHRAENVVSLIRSLSSQNDEQSWLQSRALSSSEDLLEARWTLLSAVGTSVLAPFMALLVFWLTVTFASFGLFSPRNATTIAALFLSSSSVAGAVFLVLEMDGPFDGLITVSPEPLQYALAWMTQ